MSRPAATARPSVSRPTTHVPAQTLGCMRMANIRCPVISRLLPLLAAVAWFCHGEPYATVCAQSVERTVPDLQDILTTWRVRQSRVKSIKCTWQEEITQFQGSLLLTPDMQKEYDPLGIGMPPEDITYQQRWSLVIDGERMAFTREGDIWHLPSQRLQTKKFRSVFDGEVAKTSPTWRKVRRGIRTLKALERDLATVSCTKFSFLPVLL